MNKKTYCTPAVTVANGALQPMLLSASQLKKITMEQDYVFEYEVESQENSLRLNNLWTSSDNSNEDDWNF